MLHRVTADLKEIVRAVTLLFALKTVVELRVPNAGRQGTVSGYYDDLSRLAEDAFGLSGKAPGVYVLLNPAPNELLARSVNRWKDHAKTTTSDSDIVVRRWLLIDLDPRRPAGISSTDDEHQAAIDRARAIRAALQAEGWPQLVLADSGNGAHLLCRIDLPNDPESRELLRCALEALAARYSDDVVEVDRTTFNAARISKIYGTIAAKGDSTPERPHRRAVLLDVPEEIGVVSRELLERLAAEVQPKTKTISIGAFAAPLSNQRRQAEGNAQGGHQEWIQNWISKYKIPFNGPLPMPDGGTKYVVQCPNNPDHDDAAILITPNGAIGYKCFHNSCADWGWRAYRKHHEPDFRPSEPGRPNLTDVGNGIRLVTAHGEDIRYCTEFGKWLVWDGSRWLLDQGDMRIEQLAKATITAMLEKAGPDPAESSMKKLRGHALKSENQARVRAMSALARSEPSIAIPSDQLDPAPYLLNVLNGTIDLRTGKLSPHHREDLITKMVNVNYDASAKAPRFMRFLIEVMERDRKLIRFTQRAIGYSLTGETREQVFFLLLGGGANGKSTLVGLIGALLGDDYACTTSSDTLSEKQFEGISNDLARLRKARFVVALEVEGRRLNLAKIKRLTGQDKVAARYMRAEFFEFIPEFKMWLVANSRPNIDDPGEAIWRRIRLIPFTADIPADKRDLTLPQRLATELPGILAWCVRGAVDWYAHGLGMTDSVKEATAEYRQDMDVVGQFLLQCCETGPGKSVAASLLYTAYEAWCKRRKKEPASQRAFGRNMSDRGVKRLRSGANGETHYSLYALKLGVLKELKDSLSINPRNDNKEVEVKGKIVQFLQSAPSTDPDPEQELLI